jgi:hypothetical protein
VLPADANTNAESIPDANAVGFAGADAEPHIGIAHQRAARDNSRFERRVDQ